MKIRATLELFGKTATGFAVSPAAVEKLGAGKRPPVRVTINGYTYRTTIAPMHGRFLIGVNADVRAKASVAAGDKLEVALELDTEPRTVTVPPDFASELDRDPRARQVFERLSYTNRREIVTSIEGAKSQETRRRRVDKALTALREKRS